MLAVDDEIVGEAYADPVDAVASWLIQAMLHPMVLPIYPVRVKVEVRIATIWIGDSSMASPTSRTLQPKRFNQPPWINQSTVKRVESGLKGLAFRPSSGRVVADQFEQI